MKISVVVPVFNEQGVVVPFARRLIPRLRAIPGCEFEFIFVDDGSTDGCKKELRVLAQEFPHVRVVSLAFNYGHQIALVAGLNEANGDAALTLDGDGQHPIEVAATLVEEFKAHQDVDVVQAIRTGGQSGFCKKATSYLFYMLMRRIAPDIEIVPGSSDFRLLSRRALDILNAYPNRHRNIRLLVASLPFKKAHVAYRAEARRGGDSKFSVPKMLRLAMDGVFFFSKAPLRVSLFLAGASALFAASYLVYAIIVKLCGGAVAGWTSLMGVISLMFALVFLVQSILAEYLGRILELVKSHPVYLVRQHPTKTGFIALESTPGHDVDKDGQQARQHGSGGK